MNADEFGTSRITLPKVEALQRGPEEFDERVMPEVPLVPEEVRGKVITFTAADLRALKRMENAARRMK